MAMDSTSQLRDLVENARALLAQGGTLESSSGSGPIADDDLTKAVAKTLGAAAPPETPTRSPSTTDDVELAAAAAIGRAHSTLSRIQNGGSLSNLSEDDVSALELIVHTIGRPALCYRNGRVETPLNKLGDNSRWYVLVTTQREEINRVSSCVGRLACEHGSSSPVLGTGWRVAKDLILTNRHVARSFATDCNSAPETWTLDVAKSPFIDFAYTDGTPTPARFAVTELVYCAPNGDIDLAILRAAAGNTQFPAAIFIEWDKAALGREVVVGNGAPAVFQGSEVYAVGHPYWLRASDSTRTVFGHADGRKRWSPGLVTKIDSNQPILLHDCSTLSGNSGSCIIAVGASGHAAVALHFGGHEGNSPAGSGLGVANTAVAFSRLSDHPAVAYLRP